MRPRFVESLTEIEALMSNPSRVQDAFWFRSAVLMVARPMVVEYKGKLLYLWLWNESAGKCRYQMWGDWFLDGEVWAFDEEETPVVVDALLAELGPTVLGPFTNDPKSKHVIVEEIDTNCNCELRVRWPSFEDFARDQWDRKARGNHERETRAFRERLQKSVEETFTYKDYLWVCERSLPAAARINEPPVLRSPIIRGGYWSLLKEFERQGLLRKLVLKENGERVALMVWLLDPYRNGVLLSFSHGLDSYPSIGKYLYEQLIRFCIETNRVVVNGGLGFFKIKQHFRFEKQSSTYIEVKE